MILPLFALFSKGVGTQYFDLEAGMDGKASTDR
jgi:hypothetical protein